MKLRTHITKEIMARLAAGWKGGTIADQREKQERAARYLRLPAHIQFQAVQAGGVLAEWITAPKPASGVILYLHGGGYVMGSINTHRSGLIRLAQGTKWRVLALDYRLAPEHPFPSALDDALAAYHWLLEAGVAPSEIIIMGDSAGGGLALAALVALRDAGEPLPAGCVCLSPWTDLTLTGESVRTQADADPVLEAAILAGYARCYAGEHDLTEPLISPVFADMQNLPPLLIQVGSEEILLDDARRVAERAREAGVDVTLTVYKGMFHVFQMLNFLPETKQAVAQIVEFVAKCEKEAGKTQ